MELIGSVYGISTGQGIFKLIVAGRYPAYP